MLLPSKAELAESELFTAARAGDASRVAQLLQLAPQDVNARNFVRDTPLVVASQSGHLAVVQALLRAGADVNAAFEYGASPLAVACERGDASIVRALLAAGARVDHANSWGATVLHVAAGGGSVEVVQLLLEAGADPTVRDKTGATPIKEAEKRGHDQIARALRRHRDQNKNMLSVNAFLSAIQSSVLDGVQRGIERLGVDACARAKDAQGRGAMDLALASGRPEIVRVLVDSGVAAVCAAVSSDRRTLLHRAVLTNNNDMLRSLLSGSNEAIDAVDAAGWTALHLAVRARSTDIVATLLQHGADVNVQTRGRRGEPATRYEACALHLAIRSDDTPILKMLLACESVDLNLKNDAGRTPLVYAVSLDRVEAATLLLEAGADVNVLADAGESALLVAVYRGSDEMTHALLRHGARTDVVARSGRTPLSVAKSPELKEVLQLYHASQQYHDKCFAYLKPQGEIPTIAKLAELVPLITSVYDLRHLLTLIAMCGDQSSPMERRRLLNAAFLHVVDHKLTFDDDACVFFKLSLERCEREKLIPREDFLLLDRKAEKVNTESAAWVMEMKKLVYTNSWRLDTHDQRLDSVVSGLKELHAMVMENRKVLVKTTRRVGSLQKQVSDGKRLVAQLNGRVNRVSQQVDRFESRLRQSEENIQKVASSLQSFKGAYVDRLQQEERNKKIKRVCGIVAAVAGFVLGPVLKEVADAVVDFVNPIEIVEKLYGEQDIAGFLSEHSDKALPDAIQQQLEKLAIPQDEFEMLLREEIILQHPEYLEECAERGLTINVDGGRSDVARACEPTLHAEEEAVLVIVDGLRALCSDPSTNKSSLALPPQAETTPVVKPVVPTPVIAAHRQSIDRSAQSRQLDRKQEEVPTVKATPVSPPKPKSSPPRPKSSVPKSPAVGNGAVVFVDDLVDFQYHAAVHESRGDLREFADLLEVLDTSASDLSATMQIQIRALTKSCEALNAATYAYRRGYRAVGDWLASQMPSTPKLDKEAASSVEPLEDLDDFPFVYAVDESQGDLEECKHLVRALLELADDDDQTLDATMEAEVEKVASKAVQWTAVELASHLGYEDIVKFMLKELYKASIPMKAKLTLLKAARERAAANAPSA